MPACLLCLRLPTMCGARKLPGLILLINLSSVQVKKFVTFWCFNCSHLTHKTTVFGPGGLRAPCVLACAMRSLAIVFTFVQSFFLSFFLSSPPSSAFDPLRGISRVRKFVSPNILAYLEDICKKKICFLGNFFSP